MSFARRRRKYDGRAGGTEKIFRNRVGRGGVVQATRGLVSQVSVTLLLDASRRGSLDRRALRLRTKRT